MCDLPAVVELEDIEGEIAEAVECIQDDMFVDPLVEAVP